VTSLDVTMPRLSDSMEEGTVARWLVEPGAEVAKGEPHVEIDMGAAVDLRSSARPLAVPQRPRSEGGCARAARLPAGVEAARFLARVRELLEQPAEL
jgi:pyruvate/2-oxoglutarate dehydrogenase complex dihydrolipoamide acyltransferase (E2) component